HQDIFAPDWTTMTPSRMSRTATASAMSRPNWLRVAPETSSSDPCRRLEAPGPTHSTSTPAAPAAHTDHCQEPPLGTSPAMSRRTSKSVATAAIAGRMNEAIEVSIDASTAPGAEASARQNPPDSIPRSNRYRWTFRSKRVPVRAGLGYTREFKQRTG